MKQEYKPLNLPSELVDELKIWRQAFSICYGVTDVSYGKIIRSMLDSLDETEPDVMAEMDRILKNHPEYASIVGRYHDSLVKPGLLKEEGIEAAMNAAKKSRVARAVKELEKGE